MLRSAQSKLARTVLVLGPPHSGKSTFAYLLFKHLRSLGDDACLADCDVFSPTVRKYRFHSDDEEPYVYLPPNYDKPEEEIADSIYEGYLNYLLACIKQKGRIVLDGIGKYTSKTRLLLNLTRSLIVISRKKIAKKELVDCGYCINNQAVSPADFFRIRSPNIRLISITSYRKGISPFFDPQSLVAKVYGLERNLVNQGNISQIPRAVNQVIRSIADFILNNWNI